MPIPIETLMGLSDARRAGQRGDVEVGRRILAGCLIDLNRCLIAMQPDEQMMVLSAAGNAGMECKMWAEAVSLFEQVCILAERLEPLAIETAGDYRSLGLCYSAFEQWDKSLLVLQKAREIQLHVHAPKSFIEEIDERIAEVEQRVRSTKKRQIAKTAAMLTKILDRRRKER